REGGRVAHATSGRHRLLAQRDAAVGRGFVAKSAGESREQPRPLSAVLEVEMLERFLEQGHELLIATLSSPDVSASVAESRRCELLCLTAAPCGAGGEQERLLRLHALACSQLCVSEPEQ